MRKYKLIYKYYKMGIEKGFQFTEEALIKYKKIIALYEKGERMKRKKKKKARKLARFFKKRV